jgi:DNA-binding CsgD family transcriptional regulator
MDTLLSPEKQLSSALQCLHLIIAEKATAADELQASNQELEAILEGLLSIRGDLKAVTVDGYPSVSNSNGSAPDTSNLDLVQLKRQADLLLERSQAAVRQSILLRMKAKKVRAALLGSVDGHSAVESHTGVDGHGVDGHSAVDGHATALPGHDQLSKRERQVLVLIVAGKSSKQIAAELGISFKTAVTHRASIMAKMGVHEIASVVREAIRHGLA